MVKRTIPGDFGSSRFVSKGNGRAEPDHSVRAAQTPPVRVGELMITIPLSGE
jgi:hypothetical protein